MLLAQLQSKLEARYDLELPYEIEQFFCSDKTIASHLADEQEQQGAHRPVFDEEVMFVHQDDECLEFTVYVDEALLAQVSNSDATLDGVCTIVEGASHAVCLLWHAHHERQIRPIDLELQAEIDKFMILVESHLSGSQRRELHRRLFASSHLLGSSSGEFHERYRTASQLASRYCHWLESRFMQDDNQIALRGELARFYRLSGRAKFDHIRQLH